MTVEKWKKNRGHWNLAFLDGYKPATITLKKETYFKELMNSNYPRTPIDEILTLFFQTEQQKESWLVFSSPVMSLIADDNRWI